MAATLLFIAAVVLPLLRGGAGVPSWDTIWIEDAVFTEQANAHGPFAVLFQSYSGYVQLPIRLLAVPTSFVPVSWIAAYLAVTAALVCALCAAFAYRHSAGLVKSVASRLVIATMVVLSPAMAVETTANITNTIWPILAVAPFAFLSNRDRTRDLVMRSVVVFLAATATALGALLLPLAIGCAIARRTRASLVVAGSYAVGLVLQFVIVVIAPDGPRDPSSVRVLVDLFSVRVLGSFLVGERPLDPLWTQYGEIVAVVFVLVAGGIFAYLLPGAGRRNQRLAAIFLAYAGLAFAVPAWGRGTSAIGFAIGNYTLNTTRYTVGPILFLVTAAAVLVDPGLEPRVRRLPFDGRRVLILQTAIVVAMGFFFATVRVDGPAWRAESARVFAEECHGAPSEDVVRVVTTPTTFSVGLTCRRLAS